MTALKSILFLLVPISTFLAGENDALLPKGEGESEDDDDEDDDEA